MRLSTQYGLVDVGWKATAAAFGKQIRCVISESLARQRLVDGMRRELSLHQYPARTISTPGTSRDLHELLKQTLGGSIITAVERVVGAEDHH